MGVYTVVYGNIIINMRNMIINYTRSIGTGRHKFMKYSIALHSSLRIVIYTQHYSGLNSDIKSDLVTDSTQELSKVTGLVHIVLAQMMQSFLLLHINASPFPCVNSIPSLMISY